jgi:hypothetical protein
MACDGSKRNQKELGKPGTSTDRDQGSDQKPKRPLEYSLSKQEAWIFSGTLSLHFSIIFVTYKY